jgi:Protein of unknown function (DUF4038)/Putative collagen-binding domain of a collagenase
MHVAFLLVQFILALFVFANSDCAFAAGSDTLARSVSVPSVTFTLNVHTSAGTIAASVRPAYPLKASANNRYLVDQNNVPFLMVGDSPQSLIANLSLAEATTYMLNRRSYGINTLWINILCNWPDICDKDGATFDGIKPFIVADDLSTPNPEYFQRVADIIVIAETNGIAVILDPIETSGWLSVLRTNGDFKAFSFGQFLGTRYKTYSNIIWMHGNDFQTWRRAPDDVLVQAVAKGIRSADTNHIHTVELNYLTSGSLEDQTWAPLIELNAAYTYFPTYAQVLTEYNRSTFKPVFLVEANYEFEHLPATDGGSTQNLRKQEYWAMLSGAAGQLYGSAITWKLQKGWESSLDTPGVVQLSYMKNLFFGRKWYDLVPDQTHSVITAGYGYLSCLVGKFLAYSNEDADSFTSKILYSIRKHLFDIGSITTNTCATGARASDGSLVIAYLPTIRTVTVDMSKVAHGATARWFDPTNGEYTDIRGSPFANRGSRQFTPPGRNSSGDSDWVLVLEAQGDGSPEPSANPP